MPYQHIVAPESGHKIQVNADFSLTVPDQPVIAYIEGDGIGIDISPVMREVVDAAVHKAYGERRKIHWMEVYAGDKAVDLYGDNQRLPQETLDALREYVVAIKGPLAIPRQPGARSLNVQLRKLLDLYVCQRPVRYFEGVPSPVREPQDTNMVVFRENSEDNYADIEFAAESDQARRLIQFLQKDLGVTGLRFPDTSAIGIKPVSREGSQRLVRRAIQYAIAHDRASVTLVHKGNIMRDTEGGFRDWGYALARDEFGAKLIDKGPWMRLENPRTGRGILVKDMVTDAFLQRSLLRPAEFDVIATLNLTGDLISGALSAQVGGLSIAPGANMSDSVAIFESTHGAAPKYAGKDYVNPGSLILAGAMMLRHLGWMEAADDIEAAMEKTIRHKVVTYDFARLLRGATQVSCSGFGQALIENFR